MLLGEHLVEMSQILCRGKALVCDIPVLVLKAIDFSVGSCNIDLLCSWRLVHYHHKVRSASMEVNAVRVLRLADLFSSLDRGLVYSPEKVMHMCANVNPSISIVLEVIHLLEGLVVTGNVHLEVVTLEFPFI